MIACGPEDFCWTSVATWTATNPLQAGQSVEVLARDSTDRMSTIIDHHPEAS